MTTPHIVLLPGLLCDAAVWAPLMPALAGGTCSVPDYAQSDSLVAMAQRVLAQAPAGPLRVAGHSMGGRVALEMLRLAPQRIERLALLDTGYRPLAPGAAGDTEARGRHALLHIARTQGMRAMAREWAQGMVHPAHRQASVFDDILDMLERRTPDVFAAQIQALLTRPDARSVLSALRCPLLLMCGREDHWSPLAQHEEMRALAPHAELLVVEQAGHMCPMEQPAVVGAALQRWALA